MPISLGIGLSPVMGGGSVAATGGPTLWVDSVNGSDSNSGRTTLLPKQTLAGALAVAVANDVIALAKGSTWRERFSSSLANLQFVVYGSGAAPILEGTAVVTAWSASGTANAYSANITHVPAGGLEATADLTVYEDGLPLTRVTSLALCGSTTASFFSGAENSNPSSVSVHPTGDGDPTTNGKLYEVSTYANGIDTYAANGGSVTGPIETKRFFGHYNGISTGPSSTVSKVLFRRGGIHHSVIAGDFVDCCFLEMDPNYTSQYFPLTQYKADASASDAVARRCGIEGGGTNTNKQGGFYAHDSASGWRSVLREQCWMRNSSPTTNSQAFAASATSHTLRGCYADTAGKNIVESATFLGEYLAYKDTQIINSGGTVDTTTKNWTLTDSVVYLSSAVSSFGGAVSTGVRNGTITLTRCIVYVTSNNAIDILQSTSLTLVLNRCVVVTTTTGGQKKVVTNGSAANMTYTGDYNLFVNIGGANLNTVWFTRGTTEGVLQGLAAWKTATGQDTHSTSMIVTPFSGTVANGDFRLSSTALSGITFTDATPVYGNVGPTSYWDWNARAAAAGVLTRWPTPPSTLTEMRTYIADPTAWAF